MTIDEWKELGEKDWNKYSRLRRIERDKLLKKM